MDKEDKIHFIALGGVGQSALAKILLEQGYRVSGSDINDSKYLQNLKKAGAEIFIGHNKNNLKDATKVVISSAIKEDNEELTEAKKRNLQILHRSDMLKLISEDCFKFIGFSGTHGKTTTSGLLAYLLDVSGYNPTYAIGGIIPNLNINAKSSPDYKNSYFVAELDESDGTIQKYNPNYLVINNLELDHVDFYKNGIEDLFKIFQKVCSNMKKDDVIFLNIDDKNCAEFKNRVKTDAKIKTYSIKDNADYMAYDIKDDGTLEFNFKVKDNVFEIKTSLYGLHNVTNTLAVLSVLYETGFDIKRVIPFIKEFSGMGRRFEKKYKIKNIEIVDDYAHHPTEVKCALKTAKSYTKGRVVAIFQPHRYTRFKNFFEEFKSSFDDCDILFVLDVFKAGDNPIKGFESCDFVSQINKENVIYVKGNIGEASKQIAPYLKSGDLVLTIGAGDITKMGEAIKNELEAL